ncbi:Hypothetical predicted protein [Pelobates cultripes]|uniref:exodeoxyribonuclease III n=1 Tax=Pelobates cultripes TaxID=61616 RepID=A0AAD1SJK2_PELCU|nr:Hypothetical predicted protein [Pelobates cultripes]
MSSSSLAENSKRNMNMALTYHSPISASPHMKIYSQNARGLNSPDKQRKLLEDLKRASADIVCLQETHFVKLRVPQFGTREYPMQFHAAHTFKVRGVSILIHKSLSFELLKLITDSQGRYLMILCTINDITYTIVNVYSPNSQQRNFLHKVLSKMNPIRTDLTMICRDLNHTLDHKLDTSLHISASRHLHLKPQCQSMTKLVLEFGLYDTWRALHPSDHSYTHYSQAHKTPGKAW